MNTENSYNENSINYQAPRHLAVIMDGNGRWAEAHGKIRIEGHRAGAKTVRMVIEECRRLGVEYLTLFSFSTENWKRPRKEVDNLMGLFKRYLKSELKLMMKHGVRLRVQGDLERLPEGVLKAVRETEAATRENSDLNLVLAVSYGGREEILRAVRKIASEASSGQLDPESLTDDSFRNYLYCPDVPDPDLMIRTSGELRISNFLLWQLAYSEIVVSDKYWPEFDKQELQRCLQSFAKRERRYGLTGAQVTKVREEEEK